MRGRKEGRGFDLEEIVTRHAGLSYFFQNTSGHCSREYDLNTKNQIDSVRCGQVYRYGLISRDVQVEVAV